MTRLMEDFFARDVLTVAPELLGKRIYRCYDGNVVQSFVITEVEAYKGEDDLACHASKGRTNRTEVMYWSGGHVYVYLIYGVHFMLNFVTGVENDPQAILIRGVSGVSGPGRVGKCLKIDKSLNKQSLLTSNEIWLEDEIVQLQYTTSSRIGVDYAGTYWKNKPWRFIAQE